MGHPYCFARSWFLTCQFPWPYAKSLPARWIGTCTYTGPETTFSLAKNWAHDLEPVLQGLHRAIYDGSVRHQHKVNESL